MNRIYFKYMSSLSLSGSIKLAAVSLTCALTLKKVVAATSVSLEVWHAQFAALNQISMSDGNSGSEDDRFICLFFIWRQQSAEADFPH